MVKKLRTIAEKALDFVFADPASLYKEQRHLVNQPFFFAGNNKKGVLLVHGWTSTPYEVRRLGEYLNRSGYTVLGMQLSGHGSVPRDLEGIKREQWGQDTAAGYQQLKQTCEKVYICGTSIGATLAVGLAHKNQEIAGLVLMATPYKIRYELAVSFFAKLLVRFGVKYRKKFYPPTFGAATTITRVISYQTYPLSSVLETFELIKESRLYYPRITQPCFVLQSTHDHIVSADSINMIYDEISSKIKRKKYIEKAYHTFISDIKNEHVFIDILAFLDAN